MKDSLFGTFLLGVTVAVCAGLILLEFEYHIFAPKSNIQAVPVETNPKISPDQSSLSQDTSQNIPHKDSNRQETADKVMQHGQLRHVATLRSRAMVGSLTFSPEGEQLVAGGFGGSLALEFWNVPERKRIISLQPPGMTVSSVCFSPDHKYLAIGCYDGTVRFWNPSSRTEIFRLVPFKPDLHVTQIAFSTDGRYVAVKTWNDLKNDTENLKVFDLSRKQQLVLSAIVTSVAFVPHTNTIVIGDAHGNIAWWDMKTLRKTTSYAASNRGIIYITYDVDARRTAIVDKEGVIRLLKDGEVIILGQHPLSESYEFTGAYFSPLSDILVTASEGLSSRMILWSTNKNSMLQQFDMYVSCADFSRSGMLATCLVNDNIELWNIY